MKIAIVLPRKFKFSEHKPNSIENVVRTLNQNLLSSDEIVIICADGAQSGNVFTTQKLKNNTDWGYIRGIKKYLSQYNPDLVEVHQSIEIAAAISDSQQFPTIIYRHNFIKKRKGIKVLLINRLLKKLSGIVFVSKACKSTFDVNYSKFASKSYTIPNPIDLEKWHYKEITKTKTIFYAGRAAPEKGFGELCDGLVLILSAYKDWNAILILGDYHVHQQWTDAQLEKLKEFSDRVKVLKNQPLERVISEEASAQIAIVPSKFEEPFGLVALEAHSQKCALISSGTGGLKEASGDNAIYLEKVTGEAIYNAAKTLIDNPDLRQKLAQDGYDYLLKTHNAKIRANQLMGLREQIIADYKTSNSIN